MDFISNMNQALDYIEANLTEEIPYDKLAQAAHCSVYHFQRFFTYISGIPLSEYIRRRKLSCAALELQQSDIKIIDLAVKYGYESSTSFSRAFLSLHGVTPTEARKGNRIKSYPRMSFHLSVQGDTALDYQIVSKPAFRMVGIKETVSKKGNENLVRLPELWRSQYENRKKLALLSEEPEQYVYGVTTNFLNTHFDYYIAAITKEPVGASMNEILLPEVTWAIFQCVGPLPEAQYQMWSRIFTEWIPFSGYTLMDLPEIEWYSNGDINSPNYESQIWLPVEKSAPF